VSWPCTARGRGLLLDKYQRAEALSVEKYRPTAKHQRILETQRRRSLFRPRLHQPDQELDHTVPWPKGKTTATQLKGIASTIITSNTPTIR